MAATPSHTHTKGNPSQLEHCMLEDIFQHGKSISGMMTKQERRSFISEVPFFFSWLLNQI